MVGSGNAALCAGIAALEKGAKVTIVEKGNKNEAGGNSKYTAGAMRFVYNSDDDILPLLLNPEDPKIKITEFGTYTEDKFKSDLLSFNDGRPLSIHQKIVIKKSYETLKWMGKHNIKFEPIYSRQSFKKEGKHIFWGGLTLASRGEGVGMIEDELAEFLRLGGTIEYETDAVDLLMKNNRVIGVLCEFNGHKKRITADAVILGCGGFESNPNLRKKYMGKKWETAKVRGTQHNMGKGLEMALKVGGVFHGLAEGCHATPMDRHMPNYGNLKIPHLERKNYRKICYFLGIMVNENGERFVDEGINFRNYTYAQFGRAILNQPNSTAWQIFDKKVDGLLYAEYRFHDASYVQADTIEELATKMYDVDKKNLIKTIKEFNTAIDESTPFDPTILDNRSTKNLKLNKTNWANKLNTPPFKAYPVTCGITFTYAGVKVNGDGAVLDKEDNPIKHLYACGEMVGGVFYNGYPGGSGLTSGAVFGRLAGYAAAKNLT